MYALFNIHKARKKRALTHLKFVKENSLKLQGLFQKALDLLKKDLHTSEQLNHWTFFHFFI